MDTTILVAAERRREVLDQVIHDNDDVAVAAITAAELLVGVELADGRRRQSRQRYVEAVLDALPVESYDLDVARAHALLLADVRRRGRPRGAHDLLIAATALARNREVITTDQPGFSDLPGVRLRLAAERQE